MLALTPNLQNLATVLRHRDMWPVDFQWNYGSCFHCAMGLAWQLWGDDPRLNRIVPNTGRMGSLLGIPDEPAREIFITLDPNASSSRLSPISPQDVADAIDAYLAAQGPA
jgi:hypothetical protein